MYTLDDLITNIKIRGTVPTSQQMFTPARFGALATDEMHTTIVPQVMACREDYFLTYEDEALSGSASYAIPERAIGIKLKDVMIVSGTPTTSYYSLPRLSLSEIAGGGLVGVNTYNLASGYYIEGNNIILWPTPTSGGTLRKYYFRRANDLVSQTEAGKITSINTLTNEVVVGNVPSTWTTGTDVTVISGKPGFDVRVESTDLVGVSSPTLTFSSVTDFQVGDWVSLTGYSPVIMLPVEAQAVLSQAVTVKCLEALGDSNGMQIAEKKLRDLQEGMFNTLTPRVDDSPKKCTSNGRGIMDYGNNSNRSWW